MTTKHMLIVEVDTNDGDYETCETELSKDYDAELLAFYEIISSLRKRFHTRSGISFDNNVGFDLGDQCALKKQVLSEDEILDQVPMDVINKIVPEIVKLSGLDDEVEEEKKD